jgi:hypothetical protein
MAGDPFATGTAGVGTVADGAGRTGTGASNISATRINASDRWGNLIVFMVSTSRLYRFFGLVDGDTGRAPAKKSEFCGIPSG